MEKNIVIIFAGGSGTRMNVNNVPKQFLEIDNIPIIIHTILNFEKHEMIDAIIISCIEPWIDYLKLILDKYNIKKVVKIVKGGVNGQDSIYNGIEVAYQNYSKDTVVLIHDGVRPYVKKELITTCINETIKKNSAISTVPVTETIILSLDGKNIENIPTRENLYLAQAPQCFKLEEIYNCHIKVRKENLDYVDIVDSCTLYKKNGYNPNLIRGHYGNIKITTANDYFQFEAILKYISMDEKKDIIPISDEVKNYIYKNLDRS